MVLKALIVESEPSVQSRLREALESRGHEVTVIEDGAVAWQACQREICPLVIVDETLPGMDGLQLCRQIRSLPTGDGPFVLMITDASTPSSLPDVLEVGADDFLTKPLDLGILNVRLAIAERDADRAVAWGRVCGGVCQSIRPQTASDVDCQKCDFGGWCVGDVAPFVSLPRCSADVAARFTRIGACGAVWHCS